MEDEVLTSFDAARELVVSPTMIRVLITKGLLRPTARTRSGMVLFSRAEVQRVKRARSRRQRARQRGTPVLA